MTAEKLGLYLFSFQAACQEQLKEGITEEQRTASIAIYE
jgi:hypothetical protein